MVTDRPEVIANSDTLREYASAPTGSLFFWVTPQGIAKEEMQEHEEIDRLPDQEPDECVAIHSYLRKGAVVQAISTSG